MNTIQPIAKSNAEPNNSLSINGYPRGTGKKNVGVRESLQGSCLVSWEMRWTAPNPASGCYDRAPPLGAGHSVCTRLIIKPPGAGSFRYSWSPTTYSGLQTHGFSSCSEFCRKNRCYSLGYRMPSAGTSWSARIALWYRRFHFALVSFRCRDLTIHPMNLKP